MARWAAGGHVSPALGVSEICRQVTPMLPRTDDDAEDSTLIFRMLRRLHGPRTTWMSLWLETCIALYLMLYAWVVLYLNLFSVAVWLCEAQKPWCDIGFWVAIGLSCVTVCDSIFFFIMGAAIYGRLYARQLTSLFIILSNIVILSGLLASNLHYGFYVYAVPLACSYRLLINPAYVYKRKAWNGRSHRNVGLSEVLAAIDAVPDLSTLERAALKNAADDASKLGIKHFTELHGITERTWGSDQIHRFIHAAEVALTSSGSGLEKFAEVQRADRLLIRIMKSVGSNVGPPRNYDILATQRSLMRHFFRGQFALTIAFSLLSLVDAVLVSVVQTWLVDRLVSTAAARDRESARWTLFLYLSTYILDILVYVLQINTSSLCLAAAVARLQKRIAAGMLSMGAHEHSLYPDGSLIATFSSDIARMDALWQAFCWAMVAPLCRVVVAMIYTICIKPQVGVLAVTVFPLVFTTIPQSRSASASAKQAKSAASTINMFQNGVACQRMIWLCDHQRHWLHQYLGPFIVQQRHANFRSKNLAGLVQGYAGQLATLFVGVHVAVFAWLLVEGRMTVPEFTAMMSLFLTLSGPIKTFAGYIRVVVTNAGSAQRIDEFIDATNKVSESTQANDINLELNMTESALELSQNPSSSFIDNVYSGLKLNDISFKYASSNSQVIKSVSFHVQAGEFVAIVGESGCGKSTLLSLIMTWLQPTEGTMSLNDTSLVVDDCEIMMRRPRLRSECNQVSKQPKRLRDQMAAVFQDNMLLNTTIHNNIAFGAPAETTRLDVEWAASAAGISEFIKTLPQEYESELGGAGGVSLSGGQTQRINIARALCRKPKLLLLDEATSSLDPETEAEVLHTISSLRATHPAAFASLLVICITHHPDTLKYADVVIRMVAGAIASIKRCDQTNPGQTH